MCFFFSLLPATVLTVLGYIVLCCSRKVDGGTRTFGTVLAVWTFVLAALPVLVGTYVTTAGLCPFDWVVQHIAVQK
jgi:hypothetical protein